MKNFLLNLPRNIKRLILIFVDIASLSFAAYLAFVIRAGSFFDPHNGYGITNITPNELFLAIFSSYNCSTGINILQTLSPITRYMVMKHLQKYLMH